MLIFKNTRIEITGKTTLIQAVHDQTEVMVLDNRIIMKDGFIQRIGISQEVFNHPYNLHVAGCSFLPRRQ